MSHHILVVEDSEPLRTVLAEKLRDSGFTVTESGGGEDGLKVACDVHPDLIITDLVMFPMDGIEMATKIRESGTWGKDAKIIALTNQGVSEEETRLEKAQFNAYFVKAEIALDEVVAEAKKVIAGKK